LTGITYRKEGKHGVQCGLVDLPIPLFQISYLEKQLHMVCSKVIVLPVRPFNRKMSKTNSRTENILICLIPEYNAV
jgi:hypothetical protein